MDLYNNNAISMNFTINGTYIYSINNVRITCATQEDKNKLRFRFLSTNFN